MTNGIDERRQLPRYEPSVPLYVDTALRDGGSTRAQVLDWSLQGMRLLFRPPVELARGDAIAVSDADGDQRAADLVHRLVRGLLGRHALGEVARGEGVAREAGLDGEPVEVVEMRHGERVMGRLRPTVGVDAVEQREVDDPHVLVRPLVHGRTTEIVAQLAEHFAGGGPRIGNDQQQVAGTGTEPLLDRSLLGVAQELGHGRIEHPVGADMGHRRAPRGVAAAHVRVEVDAHGAHGRRLPPQWRVAGVYPGNALPSHAMSSILLLIIAIAAPWVVQIAAPRQRPVALVIAIAVLLASPRSQVIAVSIFDQWVNGQGGELAAFGLIWTVLMTVIATIFFIMTRRGGVDVHGN